MIPKEILKRYGDRYIQSNFTPEYLKSQAEILRAEVIAFKPWRRSRWQTSFVIGCIGGLLKMHIMID